MGIFNRIKDHWQLLSMLLILWSFFDLSNYYNAFGIEIQYYITVSELILLVLPTILKGIFALIICTALVVTQTFEHNPRISDVEDEAKFYKLKFLIREIKSSYKERKYLHVIGNSVHFILRLGGLLFFMLWGGFILYCLYIQSPRSNVFFTANSKWEPIFMINFLAGFPLMMIISDKIEKSSIPKVRQLSFGAIPIAYFILFFIINSHLANRINYILTLQGKTSTGLSFKINEQLIKTDTNLVYIGATQSYLFLRKRSVDSNYIFKTSDINNLSMKQYP